jgi:Reverse transcriptase (RNA-dependent DNA polymerase)
MAPARHFPYSLPVFVIYKYTPEGAIKKARPVVNLRPLNNIAESDTYLLPLQEDILAALSCAAYISSVDFVSSFYQHFIHPKDQYRTATVFYRRLKIFYIPPMGFKNSPTYNQRTFERLLSGLLWKIVNVYIDDVNIFTKGLFQQYLCDLDTIFRRLADAGYTFKAAKTYLGFQKLISLGKLVDRLGYSTDEEKLEAIAS